MRRMLIFCLALITPAMAVDRAGKNNTTIVSELVTRVYDEGFHFASQAQVIKWADTSFVLRILNYAQEETAQKYYVSRETTIVTVSGTEHYSLPSDFYFIPYERPEFGVAAIEAATGKEVAMKPKPIGQIDMYATADYPQYFAIAKEKIYVEPVNQSSDSIIVRYSARANTLDSVADTLNLDRDYLDYMVYLAMEKIYRSILFRGEAQVWAEKQLANFAALREIEAARLAIRSQSILEPLPK